jgi:hypothetical protein
MLAVRLGMFYRVLGGHTCYQLLDEEKGTAASVTMLLAMEAVTKVTTDDNDSFWRSRETMLPHKKGGVA